MKKFIILAVAVWAMFSMSAADSFYYYKGEKTDLNLDKSKVVMISPLGVLSAVPMGNGMTLINKLNDNLSAVGIYEISPSSNLVTIRKQVAQSSAKINVQPCYKNEEGLDIAPTGYIHVQLKSASDYNLLKQVAAKHKCTIVSQDTNMPLWCALHLSTESNRNPVEVANEIYETGNFSSSSPVFSFNPLEISYDPDVTKQWGLYNDTYDGIDISASEAWNYATGVGIKIAIIDQGIELTHDDLIDNLYVRSFDAYTGLTPSKVYNTSSVGHGTHCAGIAAAVRNNGIHIAGVAPDAKLMSVSCNFNGADPVKQFTDGINWAWKNGADIISCSWRCPKSDYLEAAFDMAINQGREKRGCIVVKSAGNTGKEITYPGNYREEIIAVGNIQKSGIIANSSSHGPNMLVCAPGTNILSTMVGNTSAYKSGTSMACPHIAGVAALILERNPKLSAAKVREIIAKNTKKIGNLDYSISKKYGTWNEYYGYGLIDAAKAVKNTPR